MRLVERDKQNVWLANEIGMEQWGTPFMLRFTVSPKSGNTEQDKQGITLDYDISLMSEKCKVKGNGITQSSYVWLGFDRTPPVVGVNAKTHTIKQITESADKNFAILFLKSDGYYNPIL